MVGRWCITYPCRNTRFSISLDGDILVELVEFWENPIVGQEDSASIFLSSRWLGHISDFSV